MPESVFALPVSVEQIAAAIKQMSSRDRKRLLSLVPDLRTNPTRGPSVRTLEAARASVGKLKSEVQEAMNHQVLPADAPFFGELTLAQYHALSDRDKAEIWDKSTELDIMQMEEKEVGQDALPVG